MTSRTMSTKQDRLFYRWLVTRPSGIAWLFLHLLALPGYVIAGVFTFMVGLLLWIPLWWFSLRQIDPVLTGLTCLMAVFGLAVLT